MGYGYAGVTMSEKLQNVEKVDMVNRYILPITEVEILKRPLECLPCKYAYRDTDAVMALVEKEHPDYKDGRITGLCGNHAEIVDLEYIGYT
jgi:hypothetical protein